MSRLPLEILLQIVDALVDFGHLTPVAIPRSDWRTVQLRQWLLVSKATSETAVRHLYTHCMHISSPRSLMLLLRTLSPPKISDAHDEDSTSSKPFKYLPNITSIYLAPFGEKLDDLPAAVWLFELFSLVSPHLKRLVFDFPFRSLTVDNDHLGVYRYLRDGLLRLTNLEELVFMGNDWNFKERWAIEDAFCWWHHFHALKRLALPSPYSLDWHVPFGDTVRQSLPQLEVLIVRLWPVANTLDLAVLDAYAVQDRPAPLKIVQVHAPELPFIERWISHSLVVEDPTRVELHSMVIPVTTMLPGDAAEIQIEFVLRAAVEGSLWTLETTRHHGPRVDLYLETADEDM